MIRICKNADKPQTLDKSYNTDEVCKQLLMDQNDKCYLTNPRMYGSILSGHRNVLWR